MYPSLQTALLAMRGEIDQPEVLQQSSCWGLRSCPAISHEELFFLLVRQSWKPRVEQEISEMLRRTGEKARRTHVAMGVALPK
jgi:hypothetical protein